jgi:PAS domain S-box-containing protein
MTLASFTRFHFLFLVALLGSEHLHAEDPPKFLNLSIKEGLSQNSVWAILRDRQGFLWFGTDDGLNRFDGYRFRVYRHLKNDTTSLCQNTTRALIQDRSGRIWIGTSSGVDVYDPVTDRFTVLRSDGENSVRLRAANVTSIVEDQNGSIWVGTRTDGIFKVDPVRKTHTWLHTDSSAMYRLSSNQIVTMYLDRAGVLWVSTYGEGINRVDVSSGAVTVVRHDAKKPGSLVDNTVYSFYEDSKGRFWIGTLSHGIAVFNRTTGTCISDPAISSMDIAKMDSLTVLAITEDGAGKIIYGTFGGGVKLLDPATHTTTSWKNNIIDVNSLAGNTILTLFRDENEKIWIGTYFGGISEYDAGSEHFHSYRNENPHPALLSDNNIRSVYRDDRGSIWLGTTKGLNIYDPVSGRCEVYAHIDGDRSSLSENFVRAIFKDSKGIVWIGTRNGVNTFNRASKRFTLVSDPKGAANTLLHADIRMIMEDRLGILWFGTSAGLCGYDRRTGTFSCYTAVTRDPKRLASDNIRSILEDHTGTLWIAMYGGGVCRFNRSDGTFTRYLHDPQNPSSLSNDNASPIVEDHTGNLWIGTYGGGLNKLDPRSGKCTAYTESDGLTNNTIFGIMVDGSGKLWISTFNGVSCFDPTALNFRTYSAASGLQSAEFNLNSSYKDKDGTMFFGGPYGFTIFDPNKIRENNCVPPVYVTSMSIFNKPVRWDSVMTMKKHIVLPYDNNSFSFDFVALNYRKPELNRYRYKLEGFDTEWSPASTEQKASYTNLVPGEYVFRVIGSNNDDVWNLTGASISITITPPFWKTWWAYMLYMIGAGGLTVLVIRYVRKRHATKLIIERQQFEKERLEKINSEIARERILLRTVIDNLPMAVYAKDADARRVITNTVDLAHINLPEHEVLGRTDMQLLPHEISERSMADDLCVMQNGISVIDREESIVNGAGEHRSLLTSKIPWRDKEGTIVGLVGFALDITERKRLEQQLLQSQKLEGVGTLAGGIAHDFNNLLAMVLGSAELLRRQLSDQPELKKYVDRIIEASERGTSISRQLLIFSRPEVAELKPISLSQTITELKEMLKHFLPKSISIETEFDLDNGIIMGDAGQIHQALLNLALNAGDAMKNTGRLTIREYSVSPEMIRKRFSLEDAGAYIAVSVTDTGTGMSEKTRLRIFDPFFSTKAPGKGTGLGLGIVHGIVKNHNGLIYVESELGCGSTFTLYFPVVPHENLPVFTADAQPTSLESGTILVVDDEQMLREMLSEYLSESGYTVHMAADGNEALTFYQSHGENIDLVITDLGMPGMGGEELYRQLRRINAEVNVMVSSGYLDGTTKENLLRMGIKRVLIKPFKMEDIHAAIASVLRSPPHHHPEEETR